MPTMMLSHKIRLKPTKAQAGCLSRACGVARFVYNWALAEWKKEYEAGGKPSGNKLSAKFNSVYKTEYPWVADVHRDCHSRPFLNLQLAFAKFWRGETKYPRFKCKGKAKDSFYVANDQFKIDGNSIRLPRIGWVKMRESLRFEGKIQKAVISRTADHWYASITVEGGFEKMRTKNEVVGVDIGISTAVMISDGTHHKAPKPLKAMQKRYKRKSRELSRKVKGSANHQKARMRLARISERIANVRMDFWHKVTTKLCRENQAVGIEDLNIVGWFRNAKLSRALLDVSVGRFRPMLAYKAELFGTKVVVHDRFYPSSKTCSACGQIRESLPWSKRTFNCECGLCIDRDLNAALNLRPTTAGSAGDYACGPEGSVHRRETKKKPRRVEAGITAKA